MDIIKADEGFAGKLCSICQTKIIIGEEVVNCFACKLPFHNECWLENKGCSGYGCVGAPSTEKKETVNYKANWKTEKKCPSCNKTINMNALKCRFCFAVFESADEISSHQYSTREYNDQEFLVARNKTIAIFLISMTGLLSILGLIFTSFLIFGDRFWGVEFKRMPPVLKIISYISFCLNIFLLLALFLLLLFDN